MPVFQIVTAPVDALTAVSVPAVIIDTPYVPKVAVVNTREPLSYTALAYNAPPMPTPPTTCKAPVFVETDAVVLTNTIEPVLNVPYVVPVNMPPDSEPLLYHSNDLLSWANINAASAS